MFRDGEHFLSTGSGYRIQRELVRGQILFVVVNRRGNWVGRIVLGTKRHPARGLYVYEVSTAGHYTGANQGGPTLGKAFDSGIGGAPICTTPG